MSKQFLAVIAAVIIVFVGIFALSGNKSKSSAGSSSASSGTLTQHTEGLGQDKVTLVEYGDYECPICGEYYPVLKQVQAQFNQQIFFQFRNFPLVSIHQNAFAGARAAEAAALQNKFWEMHDALYASQDQWTSATDPTSYFDQLAQQIGLNVTQFKTDYSSDKVNNLINADLGEANKLNLTGTPSLFLDGKAINLSSVVDSSGPSVAKFTQLINAEIAKKAPTASSTSTSTN